MCSRDKKISENNLKIISLKDFIKYSVINNYKLVKLQKPIFINGELVYKDPSLYEKKEYCEKQMQTIYPEVKRLLNPHIYYVDGTEEYVNLKNEMIKLMKRR